jgi:hypothetical protein
VYVQIEKPAVGFADTCEVSVPEVFVTAVPPAFQHQATKFELVSFQFSLVDEPGETVNPLILKDFRW